MKREQIENAMNHISDSHIEEAMQARQKPHRIYWIGAVAAVLAVVMAHLKTLLERFGSWLTLLYLLLTLQVWKELLMS